MPGKTPRVEAEKPKNPPEQTRIALFGTPGVGKSALINSFLYVTGGDWRNEAPESLLEDDHGAMTKKKTAYSISEHIRISDNRGMLSFGGQYMKEVGLQLAGLRKDDAQIIWDRGFFQRLVHNLESAWMANEKFKVHCAVLVLRTTTNCCDYTQEQLG
ncbi:uncharacterized protein [Diadema antillarum]|uniref:uncharacterized protein n=1 Tax=Diadema antillarum TaxID=105358 RepID=UPI003A890407